MKFYKILVAVLTIIIVYNGSLVYCESSNSCMHEFDLYKNIVVIYRVIDQDPFYHEVYSEYDVVCRKCGEFGFTESYTNKSWHLFSDDGECYECGYKKSCEHVFQNSKCILCGVACKHRYDRDTCMICGFRCTHPTTKLGMDHGYTQTNDYVHFVGLGEYCTVCGIMVADLSYEEAHDYKYGVCSKCEHKCPHPSVTYKDSYFDGTPITVHSYNATSHDITVVEGDRYWTCTVCKDEFPEIINNLRLTEKHRYGSDGKTCIICGYKKGSSVSTPTPTPTKKATATPTACSHTFEYGKCTKCGYECPHPSVTYMDTYFDGTPITVHSYNATSHDITVVEGDRYWTCTVCKDEFPEIINNLRLTEKHRYGSDGKTCIICGYKKGSSASTPAPTPTKKATATPTACSHTFEYGKCTKCGYECPHPSLTYMDTYFDGTPITVHSYNATSHDITVVEGDRYWTCTVCKDEFPEIISNLRLTEKHRYGSDGKTCFICGYKKGGTPTSTSSSTKKSTASPVPTSTPRAKDSPTPVPTVTQWHPTASPISTATYVPTADPTPSETPFWWPTSTPVPTATPKVIGSGIGFGANQLAPNIITLGYYEQDGDLTNGPEPIEWIILESNDDEALVISKYALSIGSFDSNPATYTWSTSELEDWLNNVFYEEVFSQQEKDVVLSTFLRNEQSGKYDTDQGASCVDKVFLLSVEDAELYFRTDTERECLTTSYVLFEGTVAHDNGVCNWWLRTLGYDGHTGFSPNVTYVDFNGAINYIGMQGIFKLGIRPAMFIRLR